jgi:hypothetical protein
MEVTSNVQIHNMFIVNFRNKDSGEITQTRIGHNMILNRCWDRVCNFNTYFNYIHFGDGEGTLSPSRTTLFSPLGYKSATLFNSKNEYPVSMVIKKATIPSDEQIGKEIKEIGISDATNVINTHARLTDSEGNPLATQPKTNVDIVDLYAIVFITFQHPSNSFSFIFPNNAIAKYFIDHTNPSNSITAQKDRLFTTEALGGDRILVTKTGTRVVDVANRKVSVNTRFYYNEGNGEIRGVGLSNALKLNYPTSGIFEGHEFEDISIGVGDGVKKIFDLPFTDLDDIAIKINDTINTDNDILENLVPNFKLQDLTGVGNSAYNVTLSNDMSTIVTASNSTPYCTVHKLLYPKQQVAFNTLPAIGDVVTASFKTDYAPKTTDFEHVVKFIIQFGEGV